MLSQDLYEALQTVEQSQCPSGISVVEPGEDEEEVSSAFAELVMKLKKLRMLGYIECTQQQITYDGVICRLTYDGREALKHGSYEAYREHLTRTMPSPPPAIHMDCSLRITGNISGSNIASHSLHVHQIIGSSERDALLDQIIETLQQDTTLAADRRREAVADAHQLHQELLRSTPRAAIIRQVVSDLGGIASITSLVMQLQSLLRSYL